MGITYLIGGGELHKGETKEIDQDIRDSSPAGSSFVFFPTAAGDSEQYSNSINSEFGNHFKVLTAFERSGRSNIEDAIRSAKVIYLGGGKTELLLDLFKKWDLLPILTDAYKNGLIVAGMSAGAQAVSEYYVHEEGGNMDIRRGWGLIPYCVLVHANQESVRKAFGLYKKLDNRKSIKFVAVGEKAAWKISNSIERKIGNGPVWQSNFDKIDLIYFLRL